MVQFGKATEVSSLSNEGVLHLLLYAVDGAGSRPSLLARIAQEWRTALSKFGSSSACLILLVHKDIVAAAEAAAVLASNAKSGRGITGSSDSASTASAESKAVVCSSKVDAAAVMLQRYYKELRELGFTPQQMCTYTPNEVSIRVIEQLKSAVIARGGRLQATYEQYLKAKRLYLQDPSTKSCSPQRNADATPAAAASNPLATYWSIQQLWRYGYDVVMHHLQYGLVSAARAVLERLFLEYFNNSDDYAFVRWPSTSLERLGRLPYLFSVAGHQGWSIGPTGYPRTLDVGAELLDGLLLIASAEMACSLLLKEADRAVMRYNTFTQVAREKLEELVNEQDKSTTGSISDSSSSSSALLTCRGQQQFFLLQCYLSGLRLLLPCYNLCKPGKEVTETVEAKVDSPPSNHRGSGSSSCSTGGCGVGRGTSFAESPDNPFPGTAGYRKSTFCTHIPPSTQLLHCSEEKEDGLLHARASSRSPVLGSTIRSDGEKAEEEVESDASGVKASVEDSLGAVDPRLLMAGEEEIRLQESIRSFLSLAQLIRVIPSGMEAIDLGEDWGIDCYHNETEAQRLMRKRYIEVADLFLKARDAHTTLSFCLGYHSLAESKPVEMSSSARSNVSPATPPTLASLKDIEELSSPQQALRQWRILTLLAAVALQIAGQQRREFYLLVQLSVTWLSDGPNISAYIVAKRLLPFIQKHGWWQIELFVRRLYVESRERLLQQAGLMPIGAASPVSAPLHGAAMQSPFRPQMLGSAASYSLYKECVLAFTGQAGADAEDLTNFNALLTMAARATDDWQTGKASNVPLMNRGIGMVDGRLFPARTQDQWWQVLLHMDALFMDSISPGHPSEYLLEQLTSVPLMMQVTIAAKSTKKMPKSAGIRLEVSSAFSRTAALPAELDDIAVISVSVRCSVDPLTTRRGDDTGANLELTLESRLEWSNEEEPIHVVHISRCELASYSQEAEELICRFRFPVCHAGQYRIRQWCLRNGATVLSCYPQLTPHQGLLQKPHISAAGGHRQELKQLSPAEAEIDSYTVCHRTIFLNVPEPKSRVHLKVTPPAEAHCFADSVSYFNADVDLEDPLPTTGLTQTESDVFAMSMHDTCYGPIMQQNMGDVLEEGDGVNKQAIVSCLYEAVPGSLAQPHLTGKPGMMGSFVAGISTMLPHNSATGRGATSTPMQHPLLTPAASSTETFIAAILLNTPMMYRMKVKQMGGATRSPIHTCGGFSMASFLRSSVHGGLDASIRRPLRVTSSVDAQKHPMGHSFSTVGNSTVPVVMGTAARHGIVSDGRTVSFKSIFKPLQLDAIDAAETAGGVFTPQTNTLVPVEAPRATSAGRPQASFSSHTYLPGRSHWGGPPSEISGKDREETSARRGLFSAGAVAGLATSQLLYDDERGIHRLVLVHPAPFQRLGNDVAAVASSLGTRTIIPVRMEQYLRAIPAPNGTAIGDPGDVHVAGPILRAEGHPAMDPLRECVIRLFAAQAGGSAATPTAAAAAELVSTPQKSISSLHLQLPLLPMLISTAPPPSTDALLPISTVNQARISFYCLRGKQPCTTTVATTLPFEPAACFTYAFKHFQGRVYCLVQLQNILKTTSLWMRGAILHVQDAEPSYRIVRVCAAYNHLLYTEWKPRDVFQILYELDLDPSFRPAHPECAHQVQMQVFYSSWEQTSHPAAKGEQVVLRAEQRTASSSDVDITTPIQAPGSVDTHQSTSSLHQQSSTALFYVPQRENGRRVTLAGIEPTPPISLPEPSVINTVPLNGDGLRDSGNGSPSSSGTNSSSFQADEVYFSPATLQYLEDTCNTIWGPVATFHSKHLCVFNIVMYAESPWTMRFGAATNYVDPLPSPVQSTPLLPWRTIASTSRRSHQTTASGSLPGEVTIVPVTTTAAAETSLFGNAVVDQPADVLFVAGEPVRFCVRLQPLVQNWPEDAGTKETFFIRLQCNPAEWMVIGKQRDRRTLSLMEEETVYFTAVPLLPPTAGEKDTDDASAAAPVVMAGGEKDGKSETRSSAVRPLAGSSVKDEGILQTPTVEMFWEKKGGTWSTANTLSEQPNDSIRSLERRSGNAAMGEPVLIDVVQFRKWVRVQKRSS